MRNIQRPTTIIQRPTEREYRRTPWTLGVGCWMLGVQLGFLRERFNGSGVLGFTVWRKVEPLNRNPLNLLQPPVELVEVGDETHVFEE
jgi:hypothetical protein